MPASMDTTTHSGTHMHRHAKNNSYNQPHPVRVASMALGARIAKCISQVRCMRQVPSVGFMLTQSRRHLSCNHTHAYEHTLDKICYEYSDTHNHSTPCKRHAFLNILRYRSTPMRKPQCRASTAPQKATLPWLGV